MVLSTTTVPHSYDISCKDSVQTELEEFYVIPKSNFIEAALAKGNQQSEIVKKTLQITGCVGSVFKAAAVAPTPLTTALSGAAGTITGIAVTNLAPVIMSHMVISSAVSAGTAYGVPASICQLAALGYMGAVGIPSMPMIVPILAAGVTTITFNLAFNAVASVYSAYSTRQQANQTAELQVVKDLQQYAAAPAV